jgi:phosphoglycolate phosphatase-like HAD superfamily hydrolase
MTRAAIVDFDGTLVELGIDWPALRRTLGVRSIDDVFALEDQSMWEIVRAAEVAAAATAPAVGPVIRYLEDVSRIAILTANSSAAVDVFLRRQPLIAERVELIVARETCAGPKRRRDVFERAYRLCSDALGAVPEVLYVGDQDYELAFAADLGATVVDARALVAAAGHDHSARPVGH